ncbi:beta-galactosidase, partial [Pseudoxanthomonas sp. SGD-10]
DNNDTIKLETDLVDAGGNIVASKKYSGNLNRGFIDQHFLVKNPKLWSPESPTLYKAISRVYKDGVLKDSYETSFGIRSVVFSAETGFILNGVKRKFQGVCNHHDLGPLGAAINEAALRRRLLMLKDMGADAIRTAHNMPSPELVRLCDELGIMLIVESFDEWKAPKMKNGYNQLFDEWVEKDLINMIHANRNSPAVVLWSIGNEVPDQSTAKGVEIAARLQDICHREDPTRLVTVGMDRIDAVLKNGFAAALDLPGFNYKPSRYEEAHKVLPQGFILGSETASTVSSRGIYKFPVKAGPDMIYSDNHSSSYDMEHCAWSQTPDDEFWSQDKLNYTIGEFVWTGFDYLGEPAPYESHWPSHSSYFGIIDLAGIPKDRYYLYRSRWNTKEKTLHILPHWTWPG